jgi:hypothetical protein
VRAKVLAAAAGVQGPRGDWIRALLDGAVAAPDREAAKAAYADALRAALAARTSATRPELEVKRAARIGRARALFQGDANPLPTFGP